MSYTSYTNCLSSSSWDDTLGSIRVRWASDAPNRLQEFASYEQVPIETVKALSEHLAYATAYRIGSTQVVIQ
ncbi:MAG: hypothetical protein EOO61_16715 [Hymenobacter sp.]|nr:MAG: hypothetical protein EOO61_16715 [Hymenobacter sp.]